MTERKRVSPTEKQYRYIDADALKVVMVFSPKLEHLTVPEMRDILAEIDSVPDAYVEYVRHGRWVSKEGVYGVVYCSICDFELKIDNTPYCPNCGAKMGMDENDVS